VQKTHGITEGHTPQEKEVDLPHVREGAVYIVKEKKRSLLTNLQI
jgi:hypothetical protein